MPSFHRMGNTNEFDCTCSIKLVVYPGYAAKSLLNLPKQSYPYQHIIYRIRQAKPTCFSPWLQFLLNLSRDKQITFKAAAAALCISGIHEALEVKD